MAIQMKIPELTWPLSDQGYDEDLLLNVTAGTVVLLVRGRNAWHSTWVRHYLRNATLYTDVPSAKLGAESQRGRGNVFYLIEAPALRLSGVQSHVVLCDAHPDDPFGAFTGLPPKTTASLHGRWVDGLFPGVSVRDAVAAFRHTSNHWAGSIPNEHSLRTGLLASRQEFDTGSKDMQSFVSRPVGANYYLQWDPDSRGNRYTRSGARRVARRWTKMVSDIVPKGATPGAAASRLAMHRDDVLQALPMSRWLAKQAEEKAKQQSLKAEAFKCWDKASDRVVELEAALWDAEHERDVARDAMMKPVATAAGVRAQRERSETAQAEVERLTADLKGAEAEADELWNRYTQV